MRHVCRIAVLAAALCALTPAAAAAQEGEGQTEIEVRLANAGLRPNFRTDLQDNCLTLVARGITPGVRSRRLYGRGPSVGTLDAPGGTGEVQNNATGWLLEPPRPGRPTVFDDLGIALQGQSAYLTGRIGRGRSLSAGRVRLAQVRGAKIDAGPLRDGAGRPRPNTYSTAVSGTLVMLPAMSRAIGRSRCRGRAKGRRARRLRPGYVLGRFSSEFLPGSATGLDGSASVSLALEGASVQPGETMVAPITPGPPVPLSCAYGEECLPSGGTVGVDVGFDLVRENRRVSIGGLQLTTTGQVGAPYRTVTGTLDGTPVTIGEGPGYGSVTFTDDFSQRLEAALGGEVRGNIGIAPEFTRLGP